MEYKFDKNKVESRRNFIKTSVLGATGLLTQKASRVLRPYNELGAVHTNQTESVERNYEAKPEYEDSMKKLMITLPKGFDIDIQFQYDRGGTIFYEDMLRNLPAYTELTVVGGTKELWNFNQLAEQMGIKNVIRLSRVYKHDSEEWAQDYGKSISINGKRKFLLPMAVQIELDNENDWVDSGRMQERAGYMLEALGADQIERADFYFAGGNMMFDHTSNSLRLIIGYNNIHTTIEQYKVRGQVLTPQQVAEKISSQFGGAEVVVIGTEQQADSFYHIDLNFIILKNKQVVMVEPLPEVDMKSSDLEEIQRQKQCKQRLQNLGYEILTVKHSLQDIKNGLSSINATPYIDLKTGKNMVWFPVFPAEVTGDFFEDRVITKEDLTGKAKQAYEVFEKCGYTPIPVRNPATNKQGSNYKAGTHCRLNVLE